MCASVIPLRKNCVKTAYSHQSTTRLRHTPGEGVASRSDTVVPAQIQNKENWGCKKCLQIFWGAISCNPAYLKVTG